MHNNVSQVSVTAAILVDMDAISPNATPLQMALFDSDGNPVTPLSAAQVAVQADVAALTSSAAVGVPTKVEYDALRADLIATRTVVNSLLAKMRTAEVLAIP